MSVNLVDYISHPVNVKKCHPYDEGKLLAKNLLNSKTRWDKLVLNCFGVSSFLLSEEFFIGFFDTVKEEAPELLDDASNLVCVDTSELVEESIESYIDNYFGVD